MITVAAFHARFRAPDDWRLLRRKFAALSWVDGIAMVVDRPDDTVKFCIAEELSRRHVTDPPVVWAEHYPERDIPDLVDGCEHCDEGPMRQQAWDMAANIWNPDWIVLGDLDEWPSYSTPSFLAEADPAVDVFYLPMHNMISAVGARALDPEAEGGGFFRVGGEGCPYAPENHGSNRKGILCRRRSGVVYRYDLDMTRHCRMEPNPLSPTAAVEDPRHVLVDDPVLLHWRWWNWAAWIRHPQSRTEKYRGYWDSAVPVRTDPDLLWPSDLAETRRWDR